MDSGAISIGLQLRQLEAELDEKLQALQVDCTRPLLSQRKRHWQLFPIERCVYRGFIDLLQRRGCDIGPSEVADVYALLLRHSYILSPDTLLLENPAHSLWQRLRIIHIKARAVNMYTS